MLKAIVVDDEASSRNVLKDYIAKYCTDVQLIGEADSVQTAKEIIAKNKPDILFLDVEMPKGNGFDLLEQLNDVDFETIFVTAFDHYAIQALNYSAAYYLLKPVSIDELIAAVEKIKNQKARNQPAFHTQILLENIYAGTAQQKKIVLPLIDGFEVVKIEDILYCVANDNFTDFYFKSKHKMMICRTLKFYEELLVDSGFLRVHKSHLVNLEQIVKYTRGKGGMLTMSDGVTISVSPMKRDQLLSFFERGK